MKINFNFEKYTLISLVVTILSGTNLYFNRTLICGYYVKADLLRLGFTPILQLLYTLWLEITKRSKTGVNGSFRHM